jgi:hypothetical protein
LWVTGDQLALPHRACSVRVREGKALEEAVEIAPGVVTSHAFWVE